MPRAEHVDVDHRAELLVRQLPEQPVGADAGIGDHDVQAAELGNALVDGCGERREVARVDANGDDPAAEILDRVAGLGEVVSGRALVVDRRQGRHRCRRRWSAPSSASRTASARPWPGPRPAQMRATLFSNRCATGDLLLPQVPESARPAAAALDVGLTPNYDTVESRSTSWTRPASMLRDGF